MRGGVVGHVEWVDFVRVEAMPGAGDIVHASETWSEPGGGGPAAAVQIAKLLGEARLYTALGDDQLGHRAYDELCRLGLRVEAAWREEPTRRAITHVDASGERTITVVGDRLGPRGDDPLSWDELDGADCCYFTAGDAGALRNARRARILVATARSLPILRESHVELDALVGSAVDPSEKYVAGDLEPRPRLVVATEGERGGTYEMAGGVTKRFDPTPGPEHIVDRYGAGDAFAAGLTYGLGTGLQLTQALAVAARCGAAALSGRGPYAGQLRYEDL